MAKRRTQVPAPAPVAKSLSHSQLPQLYSELLTGAHTGHASALCGRNTEKGQCGEKAGRPCSIMLGPGGARLYLGHRAELSPGAGSATSLGQGPV